jgi:amino acid transporter
LSAHSGKKLTLLEVTAIGIGGMIGGGIFAVLGLAITLAGHSVAFTLAGGGIIALLTGISYAAMGVVYGGSGGSFTYIQKSFSSPSVAGLAGWLLVAGYVGTLALYATAFGAYGSAMIFGQGNGPVTADLLASAVLGIFLFINLLGAKLSGSVELGVVGIKLGILIFFAIVGLWGIHASHFVPLFNKGIFTPLAAVALIFVAYEGFELIPNAVGEMENPEKNLRRALIIAISLTTVIYIVVAIAALGNLLPVQIRKDQEYVLAVAARPMLGNAGFIMIGIAALLSTASAINATLFGASRLAMVMAAERALPAIFAKQAKSRAVPWVALLTLTVVALLFTITASLEIISIVASATFLLIFTLVNAAAYRQARAKSIKLHPFLPLLGALLAGASFLILLWHTGQKHPKNLLWLGAFYGFAAVAQWVLHVLSKRRERAASA